MTPDRLVHGDVAVRPLRLRDGRAWSELRIRNQAWLEPWEGTAERQGPGDWGTRHSTAVFGTMLRAHRREARAGRGLAFAVLLEEVLVGQVTVTGIVRGAADSATLGYWVDGAVAGRGVMPVGVALVVDHCLGTLGLHRVEANVRPENGPSLRLLAKLGFRPEGRHDRYLHIDGAWRDHLTFALVREELPDGLLRRYLGDTPQRLHQD